MEERTVADEAGTIEITLTGDTVDAVRISNKWRDRFDTAALSAALSEVIREALPPRESLEMPQYQDRHLPIDLIPQYLAEIRAGRAAMRRYIRRLEAGEVEFVGRVATMDPQERVQVGTVGGRFDWISINPKWAENAPVQAICDAVLEALPSPLAAEPELDSDIQEAHRHYDAALALKTDKPRRD